MTSRYAVRTRYHPSSYDDYMCLKPPVLLWIAVVFLSRAVTLPLLLGIGSLAGGSANLHAFIVGMFGPTTIFPSLIGAAVLCALIRRTPTASRAVRWIFAHGRLLLATSALVDLALSVADLIEKPADLGSQLNLPFLTSMLDLYFLVYVLAARRVRDVFADFPAPLDSAPR